MGRFRIIIDAVGGHGCERQLGEGKEVFGCSNLNCPDCRVREFVKDFKAHNNNVELALIIHWPDRPVDSPTDYQDGFKDKIAKFVEMFTNPSSVVDNLLTKVRGPGQFFPKA